MEQLKLFICLPLDLGLAKKIYKQLTALNLPFDSMRLVSPEQMHITLKFFSPIPLDKLPEIIKAMESIETSGQGLDLVLDEIKATPNIRPDLISIRLQDNQNLTDLYNKIEQSLFSAGLANLESRQFNPHLTLARIKKTVEPDDLKDLLDWKGGNIFTVNSFELMQSESSAQGPIYTTLQSFEL